MTANAYLQIGLYFAVLLGLAWPLGEYMARVFMGRPCGVDQLLGPLERGIYRLSGVRPDEDMGWKTYAGAVIWFKVICFVALYLLARLQFWLPLNPQKFGACSPDLAFNISTSFITNTNWQSYSGETTLSYLVQMLGLTVQNFVSAAAGMAVLVALIRGLVRSRAAGIGNFWVDLVRSTVYILLPLAVVLASLLVWQGVIQTFQPYQTAALVQPYTDATGKQVTTQTLALGPVASQEAIKELGTNGGGFFNANSAHPFENPTPLSNFLEMLAILLIAVALCFTFGRMVGDLRQGGVILTAMTLIFFVMLFMCVHYEQAGNPLFERLGVDTTAGAMQPGGNMEGKETRFGVVNSSLFACVTTGTSCGAVNSMHDSFTPLGGLAPMWLMQLGEVIYGGVGSGLFSMLIFALLTVFVSGLMVGRTPEYLGKKIEAFEMKMASLVILIPPLLILCGTAIAVVSAPGLKGIFNPGAHGFSEVLYAFSSVANNNGSAFAGLSANTPFYNLLQGLIMLIARFWLMIPTLAIAGALARKQHVPSSSGTLPTHTPLFVFLLAGVVVIIGALAFIPALALGPLIEHLQMMNLSGR